MNEIYITEDEYPVIYEMVETDDYTDEDLDQLAAYCENFLEEYNVLVEKSSEDKKKYSSVDAAGVGTAAGFAIGSTAAYSILNRKAKKEIDAKLGELHRRIRTAGKEGRSTITLISRINALKAKRKNIGFVGKIRRAANLTKKLRKRG